VHVKLEHKRRGDLSIVLTSPAGTKSRLLSPRPLDDSKEGVDFTFMTVHNWGEDPHGTWTLDVADNHDNRDSSESRGNRGRLISWGMRIFGVAGDRPNHKPSESGRSSQMLHKSATSREVGSDEIKRLMNAETHSKDSVQIQAKNQLSARSTENAVNGLSGEDFEFLRNLFEAEELKKRNIDENADGIYSEGYPIRKSRQWTDDEVVVRLREGQKIDNADESQLIDSIVKNMDPGTLDKIVRDLSEYINRDDA
jgi:subtilisin-like proprotein convertase family protein